MATKKKPVKPAKPLDISKHSADIGARLVQQFRDELNIIKNPGNPNQSVWGTLSEIQQDEVLERVRKRIEGELKLGYEQILANGFPAVHCTLQRVAFGEKAIQGALAIPKGSSHRHELADFSGQPVLLVLTENIDQYLQSMDKVKPDSDQKSLDLDTHAAEADDIDDDPRTLEELREKAGDLAEQIGEKDVPGLVGEWDRAHLIDYIKFAEKQASGEETAKGEENIH